jgi:DDB1- and CUL4-associated factor 13
MRRVPKHIHRAAKLKKSMWEARRAKEDRRRKHSKEGEMKLKAEKKRVVVVEQK